MNIFPLNIKNLNYMSKDKKILKDINLITSEKKVTIIAGNNGSGKSTLLKILHGIIQHTSGTINWEKFQFMKLEGSNLWFSKSNFIK